MGNQNQVRPVNAQLTKRRSFSVCSRDVDRSEKKELRTEYSSTEPRSRSCAVSVHRHHWLVRIRPTGTPRDRNVSQIMRACNRPSAERFLCGEQSPSRKPGGSPVPGAMACRIKITYPPSRSSSQSVSSRALAGKPTTSTSKNVKMKWRVLRNSLMRAN
jgi:hypothetical protein